VKGAKQGRVEVQREERNKTWVGSLSFFLGLVWLSECSHFSLPLVLAITMMLPHGRRC